MEIVRTAIIQARANALECSATDASHVAFKHRQVGEEVKAIAPLANGRARAGADAREVLVARGSGVGERRAQERLTPPL